MIKIEKNKYRELTPKGTESEIEVVYKSKSNNKGLHKIGYFLV